MRLFRGKKKKKKKVQQTICAHEDCWMKLLVQGWIDPAQLTLAKNSQKSKIKLSNPFFKKKKEQSNPLLSSTISYEEPQQKY